VQIGTECPGVHNVDGYCSDKVHMRMIIEQKRTTRRYNRQTLSQCLNRFRIIMYIYSLIQISRGPKYFTAYKLNYYTSI